ncbi:50S ribosomal protein L33 [Streptomyces inhibens]|uniref:Large ribosomal subunit protein bL33 n=1 Tax=Streptomyces inhibens TaxID=2293571 RepID=A0A371PXB7_STRIH|nr:50S ribosomal protein L33 [Streptomyces inhibens]REK86921.1 50S ribosomal protein L33 [Streptomyces inhibens]
MARNELRPIIKLRSTAGTVPQALNSVRAGEAATTYVTRKNRRNDPDRMVLRTYDPVVGRHVDFREER